MSVGIELSQTHQAVSRSSAKPFVYPERDGKRMSDNTKQFQLIHDIQGNFDMMYENDPNVFVAGDLLWYPIEEDRDTRQAPDIMLVFGRPKGHRGSYVQCQEKGVAPQVVFEILSRGNRAGEMQRKLEFYERYGVEEYYVYNPYRNKLQVWLRENDRLIPQTIHNENWISPRTGVRLNTEFGELKCWRPGDIPFMSAKELEAMRRRNAELETRTNELQTQKDELQTRTTELETKNDRLIRLLKAAGIDPDSQE